MPSGNELYSGAINKETAEYTSPMRANKSNNYLCPFCAKDVFAKQGTKRRYHFAHAASDNPCRYYKNPGESEIHKEAKLRLKWLLENPTITIKVNRKCCKPYCGKHCKNNDEFVIENMDTNSEVAGKVLIEYRYKNEYTGGYSVADVAIIVNDEPSYIFEICNKHKTDEASRKGVCWCEIDAKTVIDKTNKLDAHSQYIEFDCIRNTSCEECGAMEVMYQDFPDNWWFGSLPEFN